MNAHLPQGERASPGLSHNSPRICPRRGRQMSIQFTRQGMAALPASFSRPRSSFVRRLLRARDDAVKQRVRTWLMGLDNERLLGFGLAPEDIALLRGFPM